MWNTMHKAVPLLYVYLLWVWAVFHFHTSDSVVWICSLSKEEYRLNTLLSSYALPGCPVSSQYSYDLYNTLKISYGMDILLLPQKTVDFELGLKECEKWWIPRGRNEFYVSVWAPNVIKIKSSTASIGAAHIRIRCNWRMLVLSTLLNKKKELRLKWCNNEWY